MKQILLVCNAGMSTSMLVKKMQQSATERGIEVSIEAKSITEAKKNIHEADVILIGPQIRYELPAVANHAFKNTGVVQGTCTNAGLMKPATVAK